MIPDAGHVQRDAANGAASCVNLPATKWNVTRCRPGTACSDQFGQLNIPLDKNAVRPIVYEFNHMIVYQKRSTLVSLYHLCIALLNIASRQVSSYYTYMQQRSSKRRETCSNLGNAHLLSIYAPEWMRIDGNKRYTRDGYDERHA